MLDVRIARKCFASASGAERVALRDIAFSMARGESVGLLAPSGTGKSTLLRIVLGLDTAFEGHVARGSLRIGVMFQEPRLLPWLTVAENLRLVVTDAMPRQDVAVLLDRVRLSGAGALYPRQLSLGMARRAALARALAVSPDLLVLDEPFASLDPRLGSELARMVADWARDTGATVLLATHDVGQALDVASRLVILTGTPATLAADMRLPAMGDAATRHALTSRLLVEFSFLDARPHDS